MSEHELYKLIARYLQLQYPNVIYRFDLAADLKLTPGQARTHKKLHPERGYPDLFIAEPKDGLNMRTGGNPNVYAGLFIEIKKEGTRLKKKDGSWASDHIAEQVNTLDRLEFRGYRATFGVGFDEVKNIIDEYLGGRV